MSSLKYAILFKNAPANESSRVTIVFAHPYQTAMVTPLFATR